MTPMLWKTCPHCHGEGQVIVDVAGPGEIWEECPQCDGTGEVEDEFAEDAGDAE